MIEMNEREAKRILTGAILKDEGLYCLGWYLDWEPKQAFATLNGKFAAEDLEAIAWWMRNK